VCDGLGPRCCPVYPGALFAISSSKEWRLCHVPHSWGSTDNVEAAACPLTTQNRCPVTLFLQYSSIELEQLGGTATDALTPQLRRCLRKDTVSPATARPQRHVS
jgi:hypothetical protein